MSPPMRRAGRQRVAVGAGAALVVFVASACLPPPPPPPPPAQPCQSVGAASTTAGKNEPPRSPSPQAIPPQEAGAQARQAAASTDVRTKDGAIPIVTVEEKGGRPEITSTPVRSPDEAASVAEQKAANGDLHVVDVDKPVKALANPNDTLFGQQWSFGQVPYAAAWAADGTKGAGVTVADVDTGVMANHSDLAGQVLNGHFFLHDNSGGTAFEGDGGTSDPNGHGTHVSGTIAALSNNANGISGASPDVKILPVQVLCSDGNGFSSDVASGIVWAVDNGAKVVNLSLGGAADASELSAVQYADQLNVVVVAAGGNCGQGGSGCHGSNNCNQDASYPGAYSPQQTNVIAVAATTNANPPGHAGYSMACSYIDIAAPGGLPSNNDSSVSVLSTWNDGGYRAIAGTSMATPNVSAAASLLIAAASCSDSQVKARLKSTATDLGPQGFDTTFGAGLVNPQAAGTSCT